MLLNRFNVSYIMDGWCIYDKFLKINSATRGNPNFRLSQIGLMRRLSHQANFRTFTKPSTLNHTEGVQKRELIFPSVFFVCVGRIVYYMTIILRYIVRNKYSLIFNFVK